MSSDRFEREIAQELIDQHGDDAPFLAARRAEELRSAGGEEFARWKRIMMEILELHATQMRNGDAHCSRLGFGSLARRRHGVI